MVGIGHLNSKLHNFLDILVETCFWCQTKKFLGHGESLEPFSEASDRPKGQELGGGAVGGQEVLQEVKF